MVSRRLLRRLCALLSAALAARARRARRSPRSSLRLWGVDARPAVRLQRRRERALRAAGDRHVRALAEPAVLHQPAGVHVPAARRVLACAGAAREAVGDAFAADPGTAFTIARVLAGDPRRRRRRAARLGRRAAVRAGASACVAGALLAVAFLPVHYAHLAVNDVPALAPLCLSLVGVAGVYRYGRLRDYALAGAALGVACATKYTAGIVLLCLLAAAALGPPAPAWRGLALAGRARAWSASSSPTRTRCSTGTAFRDGLREAVRGVRRRRRQARADGRQRAPVLPRRR